MWKRPSRHKSLADATRGRDNVEIHRQVRRILNDIPDYSKDGTWGFVVYRTVYTPESNTLFPRVLEILNDYLRSKVFKEVDEFIEKWDLERWGLGPDPTVNEELMKCHKMIVHDDQAKFDGLSLDDVRTHFEEWVTGLPPPRTRKDDEDSEGMRDVWPRYRTCLVIDDEILNILSDVPLEAEYAKTCEWNPRVRKLDYGRMVHTWYIKAVQPWWEEEDFPPKYQGWTRVSLFTLFWFWQSLEDIPMQVLAASVDDPAAQTIH